MLQRRAVLQGLGGALAVAAPGLMSRSAASAAPPYLTFGLPAGVYDTAILDALPGKKPLIKLSYRPPNYETPVSYFASPITPTTPFSCVITSPTYPSGSSCRAGGCGSAVRAPQVPSS